MSTELAVRESHVPASSGFEMKPRNLDEAMKFCEIMAKSELVPKDYRDKPGNIMVAIQLGTELGLTPMRAMRCIAVINGRASMWGDEMLAMVLASPVCEYVRENESTDKVGICKVKRKDDAEEHVSTFTLEDAKRAGLLGKQGPWQNFTARQLKLRARGFALRDKFADVLAGLVPAEEAMDMPPHQPTVELRVEQPLTLKDRLKAKVESVAVEEEGDGIQLLSKKTIAAIESTAPAADANQAAAPVPVGAEAQASAPAPNVFDESAAEADWRAKLDEVSTMDDVQKVWDDIVKDKRVTSAIKPKLYKHYQSKLKAMKGQ